MHIGTLLSMHIIVGVSLANLAFVELGVGNKTDRGGLL